MLRRFLSMDLNKKLEILLFRKNEDEKNFDIFEEISNHINDKFNVISEDIDYPQEMDYYFACKDKQSEFLISINKRTFKDKVLLFATLNMESEMDENQFYDLKILLKNALKPLADKLYWIYDAQIEKQTQELYQLTSKAENRFRVLIIHYMTIKYGLDWWEQVAAKIKTDKEKRLAGYHGILTDLQDINLDMYSLDITDLTKLVESEYTFEVNFTVDIKNHHELPSDKELIQKTLRKTLKELVDNPFDFALTNEKGFWKHELSIFFNQPEDFKKKWDRLSSDRNHIAHNKVIDLKMYNVMKKTCEFVIDALDKAIQKISNSEISQEEIDYRETMQQFLIEETRKRDIEATGEKIYSEKQIENVFIEYLNENILSPADDMLYFCDALPNYFVDEIMAITEPKTLITATGVNDESFIFSIIGGYIDENEGGVSELKMRLQVNSNSEEFTIIFVNTTTELNENQFYEVTSGEYFDTHDLEKDLERYQDANNIIISQLEGFIIEQPSNRAIEKMN